MSIHKAKGLEFDAVFLYAAVESKLPGYNRQPEFSAPVSFGQVLWEI